MRPFRYIVTLLLLLCAPLFAQDRLQKQLDSVQAAITLLDNTDTTRILQAGNFILEHSTSRRQQFEILEKISASYFRVNNMNKSVAYAFRAKDVAEKSGDTEMMAQGYGTIANIYMCLGLNDKARPYLNQAIERIEKLPPDDRKFKLKALSYLELGNLDYNEHNYNNANKYYKRSLDQFNRVKKLDDNYKYHYRRSLYNIGNSYYYTGQQDSAEVYLNRALKIYPGNNPDLKYYINTSLAQVYTAHGSYQRSIDTLFKLLNDTNLKVNDLRADIYLNLSKNYKGLGDDSKYILYNEKHLALTDTVKGNELKAISTAFGAEQKSYSASIKEAETSNRWLVYSIVSVVFISISLILYVNYKKKREYALYQSIITKLKAQAELTSLNVDAEADEQIKSIYSVPASVETEIQKGLLEFEVGEGFRNPKLTISMLAVALKTNPAYLSAFIKKDKDKNFNAYINELRIRYICNKVHTHREYEKYKISYLAEDCGFTSHSAFSTVFKKVTGISPSAFLREEENNSLSHPVV
jgi:YesN/AraC family two-component response regulator